MPKARCATPLAEIAAVLRPAAAAAAAVAAPAVEAAAGVMVPTHVQTWF